MSRKTENRPNCPECGSSHVISRGTEWGCADCGRRWVKHYRDTEKSLYRWANEQYAKMRESGELPLKTEPMVIK